MTNAINKVLHCVHPSTTLSQKGRNVIHDVLGDMFEKLSETAKDLMRKVGRCTSQVQDIAEVTALLLHGELCIFAISKGLQAMTLAADLYGLDTHEAAKSKFVQASKCAKW